MNMDTQAITQAITTVGFPIVMVFVLIVVGKYLFDEMRKSQSEMTNKIDEIQDKQNDALNAVKEALNNNTAVIQNLKGIIEATSNNK